MKINSSLSRILLLIVLPCVLMGVSPAGAIAEEAAEERVPQVTRSDAYRLLRRGDELRERREWAEAVHVYYSALEKYQLLARTAPAWEQDYFRFRIGYCERELAMIVRTTGRSVDDWLGERAGAVPARTDEYRARYYALQEENRYLRGQLDALRQELEVYREMEDIEQEREEQRAARPDAEREPRGEAPPAPRSPEPEVTPVRESPVDRPVPRRQERPALDRPVPLR